MSTLPILIDPVQFQSLALYKDKACDNAVESFNRSYSAYAKEYFSVVLEKTVKKFNCFYFKDQHINYPIDFFLNAKTRAPYEVTPKTLIGKSFEEIHDLAEHLVILPSNKNNFSTKAFSASFSNRRAEVFAEKLGVQYGPIKPLWVKHVGGLIFPLAEGIENGNWIEFLFNYVGWYRNLTTERLLCEKHYFAENK